MNILVNVINQKLKIKANTKRLVSGTQKFIRFEFSLNDAWDDLLVFAQFIQNGRAYNDYLDENNSVYLPPEITEGKFNVLLYGSGSNVIATTNYLTFEVDKNMLVSDAQSTEITESLYNKLVNIVKTYASQSASGAPTPVSSSSLMTDSKTIYLYTGSEDNFIKGDWYYFSNGELQHGGTYGVGVTDSSLTIEGAAADAKVVGDEIIDLKADLNQAIEDFAVPTQEAVDNWLDDHPEATTTVQDGAITRAKIADGVLDYVTPEMFGAVGDGVTDDTQAIQDAVNSGKNVLFLNGEYACSAINITTSNIIIDGNFSTLSHGGSSGFIISKMSHNVVIRNINSICVYGKESHQTTNVHIGINADAGSPNDEYYAYNIIIENCSFSGGAMGFSATSAKNIIIRNCEFKDFVYKLEDSAGGYGILLQSCIDVKITDCNFMMGAYGRHDVYISVDQRKINYIRCKNVTVDHCYFDHSLLETDTSGYYYSPNTVAINVRSSENVTVKNNSAYSVTGLITLYAENGDIIGASIVDNIVDTPIFNNGLAETKRIINVLGRSENIIQAMVDNISIVNLSNNYSTFMEVSYGTVFVKNSNIDATRILCGNESTIFIDNIKTAIPYYFCRFNGTTRGYINNIYFEALTGNKYYYASGVDVSDLRIKDDEYIPALINLTPNSDYISGFTNNSYRVGKMGFINCYFTVSNEIPTNQAIITLSENVKTRFDGIIYLNNTFKGRAICQNSTISPNVAIPANISYHSLTAVIVFN